MSSINDIIRRSSFVDTSGAEPPRGIQMAARMAGGVYATDQAETESDNVLNGRISLGIVAAFVLGAVGFYVYTSKIQGGG